MTINRVKTKILILLLLTGYALFFYKVGDRDLWAPDEDEYAQMSREMIRFNNWAFPTVNGQPWAIKPVLYNWLIAVVSLPWGDVNEFRARVFSSLAALGTFLATFYLGRRAFSPLAGLLSAAVLGTSVLFLQYARWSQTNMLSTFFMMFAVFLFYRGYTDPLKRTLSYLLMYASVGLGVLTMGPVNLIMPGMVVFFYLIVMKDFKHIKQLRLGWGILIFAGNHAALVCPGEPERRLRLRPADPNQHLALFRYLDPCPTVLLLPERLALGLCALVALFAGRPDAGFFQTNARRPAGAEFSLGLGHQFIPVFLHFPGQAAAIHPGDLSGLCPVGGVSG